MPGIVLTLPIAMSKVEAWRRFCQQMSGSRFQSYEASRQDLGITRERLALVESQGGSAVVMTLEAPDVSRALVQMAASANPFDRWYRDQCQEIYGIHLAGYERFLEPEPYPRHQELLFEWSRSTGSDGSTIRLTRA